ncbi:DNA repair exonuclease [Bacillus sp. MRMR6]|uniref:metallophosphoesterase family protein n=1 Tax=Bacillus sp. MRMR6 TaxID=1928617 RepID=UPI00095234D6|nr:DNA repair exonuclease [Bacillus sp. MRMR6]OLS36456.1 DNA repair exonuclease [Bacillus sp. MRMR6]
MKQISFIHAADLHLDSPMIGLKDLPAAILSRLRESTFTALKRLTSYAIDEQVDFVILAGDLFDGEDRSLRAQSRFRNEMLRLAEAGIPVYVVHGNHDHLNGTWVHIDMPPNVKVFDSEVEMKVLETRRGDTVHLYGFSYPTRHVYERKIDDYKRIEPADFHIGILHGNESSSKEHDNYAPFSVKDLIALKYDYWALGHIHKRTILSEHPSIVYPGNIQGRNKKELEVKGCYHVNLDEFTTSLEFTETSDVVWEEAVVDADEARNFQDIIYLCQKVIYEKRKTHRGTLLHLKLQNVSLTDSREINLLTGELLEVLNDNESEEESFVWVVELTVLEGMHYDRESITTEANFFAELFETRDQFDNPEQSLALLYEHQLGRKYIAELTEVEQKELLEKAEKLLINLLYQK